MASTQIAFGVAENNFPVVFFAGQTFEVLTPSGVSSKTTLAAHASQNIAAVATDTAAVYVTFGDDPTASSTTGNKVPPNAVAYFRIKAGDKAAVITA